MNSSRREQKLSQYKILLEYIRHLVIIIYVSKYDGRVNLSQRILNFIKEKHIAETFLTLIENSMDYFLDIINVFL